MRRSAAVLGVLGSLLALGVMEWDRRSVQAFRDHAAALLAAHPDEAAFMDDGWAWDRTELEVAASAHLFGEQAPRGRFVAEQYADPIAAISDYSERLETHGIQLFVVPVPPRPFIYPSGVRGGAIRRSVYGSPHDELLDALEARGVQTIDLLPVLRAKSYENPDKFVNAVDQHWTGHGAVIAAREVAAHLHARGIRGEEVHTEMQWERRYVRRGLDDRLGLEPRDMPIRVITDAKGEALPVRNPSSPVTFIGDSNLGWYHNRKAGFQEQVTHELGYAVDAFVIHGGGATNVREAFNAEAARNPDYLASREAVVWLFMEGTTLRRNWEITPIEIFPSTRFERLKAPLRPIVSDHRLIRDGVSEFEYTKQWFPTVRGGEYPVVWLRGSNGEYHFDLADPDLPKDIILEIKSWPHPAIERSYEVRLNRRRIGTIAPSPDNETRHRLGIPPGILREGKNTLDFVGTPKEGPETFTLGIAHLTLVATERLARVETPFRKRKRPLAIELEAPPAKPSLRWRVRAGKGQGGVCELSLVVNDQLVVQDLAVDSEWTEGGILLPAHLLESGSNVVEVVANGRVLWDFIEIDG